MAERKARRRRFLHHSIWKDKAGILERRQTYLMVVNKLIIPDNLVTKENLEERTVGVAVNVNLIAQHFNRL